jgi:AcrR family transcriptional regulator
MTPQQRRQFILDTAMDVIAEVGYKGLSLRELARRCGMSAPGVLHYFPDMPSLLLALLHHRDEIDEDRLADLLAAPKDLRATLDTIVDYNVEHPQQALLYARMQAEALDPGHPARAYFDGRTNRYGEAMRKYVDPDAPAELLRILPAVLDGLQLHWLMDPDNFDLRTQWAVVADALFARYAESP